MTPEQIQEYLDSGGTDQQYLLEHLEAHSTDDNTRRLIGQLFENTEDE